MTEHTRGPWVITGEKLDVMEIHGDGGVCVAQIRQPRSRRSQWPYMTGMDNARLICAAPDLLAALHNIADDASIRGPQFVGSILATARAAIDKVRS